MPARCCIPDDEPALSAAVCAVLASSLSARVDQCRPLPRSPKESGVAGSQCFPPFVSWLETRPSSCPRTLRRQVQIARALVRVPAGGMADSDASARCRRTVGGRVRAADCWGWWPMGKPGSRRLALSSQRLSLSRQRSLLVAGLSSAPCLSWEVGTWGER